MLIADCLQSNVMLDMRLRVECPLEHRDFISGKKEGKVKKVMQATGTRIRYEAISECAITNDASCAEAMMQASTRSPSTSGARITRCSTHLT